VWGADFFASTLLDSLRSHYGGGQSFAVQMCESGGVEGLLNALEDSVALQGMCASCGVSYSDGSKKSPRTRHTWSIVAL
jgi:hypothetical protein